MPSRTPLRYAVGIAFSALLFLTACSTTMDIADQSSKANLGIEQAHNRVLVLNALRASKRRPMYFTAIVSMSSPVQNVSPTLSLAIPFGGDNVAGFLNPALRAEVPLVNLAVLDSQKFVIGITTPLRPALVKYYFDQRWPAMLLFSLMIREILYEPQGGQPERQVVNFPGRRQDFEAFQSELAAMLSCGLRLVEEDLVAGLESPSFTLPESSVLLSALSSAARDGHVVVPRRDANGNATGQWQLARPRGDVLIAFIQPDSPECLALPADQRRRLLGDGPQPGMNRGAIIDIPGPLGSRRSIRMMVRSPEAILYYLGELVRAEQEGDVDGVRYTPTTRISPLREGPEPIFKINAGEVPSAFVTVEYDAERYSVASGPGDRSSHSLTLISQLIGLQKEASELPITAPIRVIGP
jgi:hypothetical protein